MSDIGHEPSLTPPDDGAHVVASCGHEIYATDRDERENPTNYIIEWRLGNGKSEYICYQCLLDRLEQMTPLEKIRQFDCDYDTIEER